MAQANPTWFQIHSGLMTCGAVRLMLGPFLLPLGPFCLAVAVVGLAVILNGFVFGRSERAQH